MGRMEKINIWAKYTQGLPWWFSGKESTCNTRDLGSNPRLGRYPGEGNGSPPVFLPGKVYEPSGLQSIGSQRVRHNGATNTLLSKYTL